MLWMLATAVSDKGSLAINSEVVILTMFESSISHRKTGFPKKMHTVLNPNMSNPSHGLGIPFSVLQGKFVRLAR